MSFMIYIFGEKKVIFIEIGKSNPIGPPPRQICYPSSQATKNIAKDSLCQTPDEHALLGESGEREGTPPQQVLNSYIRMFFWKKWCLSKKKQGKIFGKIFFSKSFKLSDQDIYSKRNTRVARRTLRSTAPSTIRAITRSCEAEASDLLKNIVIRTPITLLLVFSLLVLTSQYINN